MTDLYSIKNPCQSICIVEEIDGVNDYCIGCFRTVSEIQCWYDLSDDVRQEILDDLPRREECA